MACSGAACVLLALTLASAGAAFKLLEPAVPGANHNHFEYREPAKCGYESCPTSQQGTLNIHIVPHTHDDVGWLKTVDQYYYGSKSPIQKAGVQYILDSVVKELLEDPKRRFIYVETAFLWKWWQRQSDATRHKVRGLVNEGRLEFIGGAWSMNDEATTHYHSIVDQFTWGLRKLNDTFGACGRPRVGWQIDPFGHSREFANLLAAMGYDGLFHGRIDYQDKYQRMVSKAAEMVWRGSDDLGWKSDIFTGVLYNTYSPPPGFCFDVLCADEPIIDDPLSPDYNVDRKVTDFVDTVKKISEAYPTLNILVTMGDDFNYQMANSWFRNLDLLIEWPILWVKDFLTFANKQHSTYTSNNIIVTMGGDFTYMDATMWYTNLDRLIQYTNKKSEEDGLNVNAFYSTPSCYLQAVHRDATSLPTKQDDFFPYASDPHAYWTGYFTSRPTLKYFERQGNSFLQMAKQLYAMTNLGEHNLVDINALRSAMGVMQHHDAVTGTEKQHVALDYARLLDQAIDDSLVVTREALGKLMGLPAPETNGEPVLELARCQLNISQCLQSEFSRAFVVTIYNPLSRLSDWPVRIPITDTNYQVYNNKGQQIETQIVPIPAPIQIVPTRNSSATHELVFQPRELPALGYRSYYVTQPRPAKPVRQSYENDFRFRRQLRDRAWRERNDRYSYRQMRKNEYPEAPRSQYNRQRPADPLYSRVSRLETRPTARPEPTMKHHLDNPRRPINSYSQLQPVLADHTDERMLGDEPMIVQRFDDAKFSESVEHFISNEFIRLDLDPNTGQLTTITLNDETPQPFYQQFYFYEGAIGNNSNFTSRASGAYIFRPKEPKPNIINANPHFQIFKGPIVQEIHQTFSTYISQVIRIYKAAENIEFQWNVGPIPVDDHVGKEIITRYSTHLDSRSVFYTDSNGRQMLKRIRGKRPTWDVSLNEPVSGNYYPVTSKISIKDEKANIQMSVLTDRAQGGTSLNGGQIEIMLHRRLLNDDGFGVGEALNEMVDGIGLVAVGKHYISFGKTKNRRPTIESQDRIDALKILLSPQVFISRAEHLPQQEWLSFQNNWSGLAKAMPVNAHIMTLEPWKEKKILLRLEHIMQKTDDPEELSKEVVVDLKLLFTDLEVVSIRETKLAANQWFDGWDKKFSWRTQEPFSKEFNAAYVKSGRKGKSTRKVGDEDMSMEAMEDVDKYFPESYADKGGRGLDVDIFDRDTLMNSLVVKLEPMEIRTFLVEAKREAHGDYKFGEL